MLHARSLTHWSIPVEDLSASEVFYRDFLGVESRGRLAGGRASCFRVGGADFILWETGQRADPRLAELGVHYAFTVSPGAWDEAVRAIAERGLNLRGPIIYRARGLFLGREIYFFDPSGNIIELTDPTWAPGMPTPPYEEIVAGSS